ncbi:MAG: hypothetical protein IKM44_00365 [Clostridia bacterium]|nr:hypothetical protein [Clostridia bacterium]
MIAVDTSRNTLGSILLSKPSLATIGCASLALLLTFSSTNAPDKAIGKANFQSSSIVSTQTTELYAYNNGNIISYFTEDYMFSKMLNESLKRLEEIKRLEYNWNGYEAEPFSAAFITRVETIVRGLLKQPKIYPTAQSSIQLEYKNENGDYLEFEIFRNGIINQFLLKKDGESETHKRIPKNTLNRVIESFYE